jgi:hypothetical protein
VRPIARINAGAGSPFYALVVRHEPITDSRLSLADIGLYMRCRWVHDVCGDHASVDWMIREFDMPEAETRAGLERLVAAGYIEVPTPEHVEARLAYHQAVGIREALERVADQLAPAERAAVERLADITEEHSKVQARAGYLFDTYDWPDSPASAPPQ